MASRDKAFCAGALKYKDSRSRDYWSEEILHQVIDLFQLNPEEEQYLRDLGRRVADINHPKNDPHILVRYMNGPWGREQAEKMFRKMIEWRKQNKIDTILDDYVPPQLLLDCIPSAILQDYDKDGDPIYVERGGAVDTYGLLKMFSKQDLIRFGIWTRERNTNGIWINDYEKRQGKRPKGITIIYDLKGLSTRHISTKGTLDYFKELMRITQEYFPGPIKKMIIIRAPRIFTFMWTLVRNLFPASARAKMIFLGNTGYLEVLDQYMDINVLPRSIYEGGVGETAVGMMQHLDGVESVQAYLEANYPSKASTAETDEESSLSSDSVHGTAIAVRGKIILRGHWHGVG